MRDLNQQYRKSVLDVGYAGIDDSGAHEIDGFRKPMGKFR